MQIRPPRTEDEFRQYYALRWEVLRRPWGQKPGSEKDEYETVGETRHLMVLEKEEIVGAGRLHQVDEKTAQIRFMAVAEGKQGRGIGKVLLEALEELAAAEGYLKIILHAREEAVSFYQRAGYRTRKPGPTLYGTIRHQIMEKNLKVGRA